MSLKYSNKSKKQIGCYIFMGDTYPLYEDEKPPRLMGVTTYIWRDLYGDP